MNGCCCLCLGGQEYGSVLSTSSQPAGVHFSLTSSTCVC